MNLQGLLGRPVQATNVPVSTLPQGATHELATALQQRQFTTGGVAWEGMQGQAPRMTTQ